MATDRDRTLALAGVFQAAALTQELARRGRCDETALAASVHSLFAFDAPDTRSIFAGVHGLTLGLKAVYTRMATQAEISDFELGRYVQTLTQLAGKLQNDRTRSAKLHDGISTLVPHMERLRGDGPIDAAPPPDDALCDSLATLYVSNISIISPQIIVHGEHGFLSDEIVVARVRTSLLAGIRAAWLWQQLGGRKWQLVLQRRGYIETAGAILNELGIQSGL